jgi:hypothetical protein
MLYATRGNPLVQLLHCLSLFICQPESTLAPAARLLLSQSQRSDLVGHHLRLSNLLERISRPSCEQLYATDTSHRKQETFLYKYHFSWVLLPTKNGTRELCSSVVYSQARQPFWLLKLASENAHGHLLSRLSLSWTMLLPSETGSKPITSITAVLLPFVTYLLTLPHNGRCLQSHCLATHIYATVWRWRYVQEFRHKMRIDA